MMKVICRFLEGDYEENSQQTPEQWLLSQPGSLLSELVNHKISSHSQLTLTERQEELSRHQSLSTSLNKSSFVQQMNKKSEDRYNDDSKDKDEVSDTVSENKLSSMN